MKYRNLAIFMAGLAAAGCSLTEPVEENKTEGIDTLTAVIEQPDEEGTKTTLNGLEVVWSAADLIKVQVTSTAKEGFNISYYNYKYLSDGVFNCQNSTSPDKNTACQLTAVYPASVALADNEGSTVGAPTGAALNVSLGTTQDYAANSFGQGAYPMVAVSSTSDSDYPNLKFKGTCGIVKLNLRTDLEGITLKTVSITADKGIAGPFKYENDVFVYTGNSAEEDRTVVLNCGEGVAIGKTAIPFHIVLPQGNYSTFTIALNTDTQKCTFTLNNEAVAEVKVARASLTDISLTANDFKSTSEPEQPEQPRYEVAGTTLLTYDEAKSHSSDMAADIEKIFKNNSLGGFGVDGYGKDDGSKYMAVVLYYPTTDARGSLVWASGRIYYNCDANGKAKRADHIVLNTHYTIGANSETPSGMYTFDVGIATQKGLVVAPDYVGYGLSGGAAPDNAHSSSQDHPYMAYDLCAKQSLDMVRAAKAYMADQGQTVADSTPLYLIGYSQGGGTALGTRRYIENNGLGNEFNLTYTYCGGGVYSPKTFFTSDINGTTNYPAGIPLIIIGMKTAYPEIMTDPLESYFSDKFLQAGIIDKIRSKAKPVDSIASDIANAVGGSASSVTVKNMFSEAMKDENSSQYKNLMQALELQELSNGWVNGKPTDKLYFFHYKDDETVNIAQFNIIKSALGNSGKITYEDAKFSLAEVVSSSLKSHRGYAGVYYARMMSGAYKK